MEELKNAAEIVIRESRFLSDEGELESLCPGIGPHIPPLTHIDYADKSASPSLWGYPIAHDPDLLDELNALLVDDATGEGVWLKEDTQPYNPESLQNDSFFKCVSRVLVEALAAGPIVRLDSVLWLYLADLFRCILYRDDRLSQLGARMVPRGDWDESVSIQFPRGDPKRFGQIIHRVLKRFSLRCEFANRSMRQVFDDIPLNPLLRFMLANRLALTWSPGPGLSDDDLRIAVGILDCPLDPPLFTALHGIFRRVIAGIIDRRGSKKVLPLDAFFIDSFCLHPKGSASWDEAGGGEQKERSDGRCVFSAELLAFRIEPIRYLFNHLHIYPRRYLRGALRRRGSVSEPYERQAREILRDPVESRRFVEPFLSVVREVRRWDLFRSLMKQIRWVERTPEGYVYSKRLLDQGVAVFDLRESTFRRARHGTAVFFDLIRFTEHTKKLLDTAPQGGGTKRGSGLSGVSLGIQRIFSIRNKLAEYGGIPQGFEGDAILDVFPRALDALRYVALFELNYQRSQELQVQPFERKVPNPFTQGFRVGMATGSYSVIPILGRYDELRGSNLIERAVGHTINKASRLNSGKRVEGIFLSDIAGAQDGEVYDPLGIFRVHVSKDGELVNEGIASFEETFHEIREEVKGEHLPLWMPEASHRHGMVAGVLPRFHHYRFEMIFEDERTQRVILVRRLKFRPQLKGIEDERVVVYEYILKSSDAFRRLLEEDERTETTGVPPWEADESDTLRIGPAAVEKTPEEGEIDRSIDEHSFTGKRSMVSSEDDVIVEGLTFGQDIRIRWMGRPLLDQDTVSLAPSGGWSPPGKWLGLEDIRTIPRDCPSLIAELVGEWAVLVTIQPGGKLIVSIGRPVNRILFNVIEDRSNSRVFHPSMLDPLLVRLLREARRGMHRGSSRTVRLGKEDRRRLRPLSWPQLLRLYLQEASRSR